MAQTQAIGIAPRYNKPATFGGTAAAWRVLCDLYPAAETPEIILAVTEYCAARRLDPLRRPVHVVSMYNGKLRRKVQVVMAGINEIETTAHRSGLWAGMDEPRWGPPITRRFRGDFEDDRGEKRTVEIEMTYPESCSITVWRIVAGDRRPFTETLYWEEAYARASFRSAVPNNRWQQAPRQMLHKCTKAAVLRAAFPEEGMGYAAEEMEDKELDSGGVTIEGRVDHGDPTITVHDRRIEQAPPRAEDAITGTLRDLDIEHTGTWLKAVLALLADVDNEGDLGTIVNHRSMHVALARAPSTIRANLQDAMRDAHDRINAAADEAEDPNFLPHEAVADLIAEVDKMDLISLNGLPSNALWRARVRDAGLIPPDYDQLDEAIATRKAALRYAKGKE